MSYQKNDNGTVTISATLRDEEMSWFLLAWGMIVGAMQGMDPRITWLLISMMNRFMEGNPEFVQYEVPADRTRPFQPEFLYLDTPKGPKQ
jgi:hypothetical protein